MIRQLLIILMVVTFFASSAISAETRVRVFSGAEFAIILEKDESGAPKGLAADILDRISTELDIRFEVKFYPWKRALLAVKNGSVDGIIDAYQTAERHQFLVFTEKPFHIDRMVFVAREEWQGWRRPVPNGSVDFISAIPARWKGGWNGDWETLKGEKILQIRGWAYGTDFEAAKKSLNVKTVNNIKDDLRMLFLRQADMVVANEKGALVEIELEGYGKVKIVEPSFQSNKSYFAFSKKVGDKKFQSQFNAALNRMWRNGEMDRLLSKYRLSNPLDHK